MGDDSVMSASVHPRFEFGFLPPLFAAWDDRTERGGECQGERVRFEAEGCSNGKGTRGEILSVTCRTE